MQVFGKIENSQLTIDGGFMMKLKKTNILTTIMLIVLMMVPASFASMAEAGGEANPEQLVNLVDIGNVWTKLDPFHDIVFTAEINPNEEGLSNIIAIGDESWANKDGTSVITRNKASTSAPLVNETYRYSVTVNALGDKVFDTEKGFRFVYGGKEYGQNDYNVSFSNDCKQAVITGFIPDKKIAPIKISSATISGIESKTYNGKAQTQKPVVKVKVNGDTFTLKKGKNYNLSYKNNKNAGKATITISGIGAVTGSVSKTFKINPKKITPKVTLSKKA